MPCKHWNGVITEIEPTTVVGRLVDVNALEYMPRGKSLSAQIMAEEQEIEAQIKARRKRFKPSTRRLVRRAKEWAKNHART